MSSIAAIQRRPAAALANPPLLFGLVATALGFSYSLQSLGALAASATPVGFVAFVPFMSAFWAYARLRLLGTYKVTRDDFVDNSLGGFLVLVAAVVVLYLPTVTGWYYWLDRWDLLALPIFVAGLVALLWGAEQVWRLWPPLLYLFLVWPAPFLWAQVTLGTFFRDLAVGLAGPLQQVVGSGFVPSADDPYLFLAVVGGQEVALRVDVSCSGMNSMLAFLAVGLPVVCLQRGSGLYKAFWLAVGAGLMLLANVVRLVALFLVAQAAGLPVALRIIHPVAGGALFLAVFLAMIWLLPRFGLSVPVTPPLGGARGALPGWRTLALTVALAAVIGFGDRRLAQFSPLTVVDGSAAVPIETLLPEVSGWRLVHEASLDFAEDYFGRQGQGELFSYRQNDDNPVYAQVILTQDRTSLDLYSVESCYRYHGDELPLVQRVRLPTGMTATYVHYVSEGVPGSSLYWIQPVLIGGELYHERVTLILDLDHVQTKALPVGVTPPAVPEGLAINTSGVAASYGGTDRLLGGLASQIVRQVLVNAGQG